MDMRRALLWMWMVGLAGGEWAWAGGGPLNTLVIVNDNSPVSQEIGQYYQDMRGLPERHVFHVRTTTGTYTDLSAFTNEVVLPVQAYLAAAGLTNQIDCLVLTRDLPYRVIQGGTQNGSSSILFYDFHADGPPCSLSPAARSDYYQAESAFAHAGAPSSNRYYLSTILSGNSLDEVRRTLDRAHLADGSAPTGRVVLLHTTDYDRTVRWSQFDDALFTASFHTNGVTWEALDSDGLSGVSNLVGYLTGRTSEPNLATLGFVPGALADHLTSYGGFLVDPVGQMSILQWLAAGAAGSYGTVVEPCNYTQKFPHTLVHFWYGRGFSLAESYAMAVQYPYMGVMVGDPLAAPYAVPPQVTITGLVADAVVTGEVVLAIRATTSATVGRVGRIEVWVDGYPVGTATNLAPTTSNIVSATVGGSTRFYAVKPGETLEQVTAGLAARINAAPPIPYTAEALGDRIQLVQDTLGTSGAWVNVSADSAPGTAAVLTVFARSVFTNFMESPVPAREGLLLAGNPVSGDVVRVVVTRLDGAVITNQVVATAGDSSHTLMNQLVNNINADTNLTGWQGCRAAWLSQSDTNVEAWLVARTNGWRGHQLTVTYSILTNVGSSLNTPYAFSDNFNDNAEALGARAVLFLSEGGTNVQVNWTLSVTNLPDGPHAVEVVAYEGSAVRVQGRARVPFVVDRHNLTCAITNMVNGRYVLRGGAITTAVESVSPGAVTQVLLRVEGKEAALALSPPYQFVWPTTNYGAGVLGLQAQAWDDAGNSTVSAEVHIQLYTDDDADGLPDQWEYRTLGSATNGTAGGNPDGDGADNMAEFLADTDPQDDTSEPELRSIELGSGPTLGIPVSSNRSFAVEINDASLVNSAWNTATNLPPGTGLVYWVDNPTNEVRFYRVRAGLP